MQSVACDTVLRCPSIHLKCENVFNPFPGKSVTTLKTYELFIYGDTPYITNPIGKNMLNTDTLPED